MNDGLFDLFTVVVNAIVTALLFTVAHFVGVGWEAIANRYVKHEGGRGKFIGVELGGGIGESIIVIAIYENGSRLMAVRPSIVRRIFAGKSDDLNAWAMNRTIRAGLRFNRRIDIPS